jgi:hypothetical protein
MTEQSVEAQLRAELLLARRHAHTTDAERAEAEARLHETRAALEMSRAREERTHAAAVNAQAAVAQVRRLCDLTIQLSVRVQAVTQARDTLAVVDACMAGETVPGDAAWGTVWLHGNWRYLTSKMTTAERETAADAVARWFAALHADDPDIELGEPDGLRWWRDDR